VAFAAISAVSALLFFPWELTRKDPIVEVRLLFQRQFGLSFLVMATVGAVLFGSTQLLPQLLQTSYGYTATLSGLALMPGGLVMLIVMPIAGQVAGLVQPKYLIAGGMLLIALAMWHMTSLVPDADFGYFAWARIYQMIGLPFLFIPITTASYSDLRPEQTNQASALINVARNLGGSIGVSLANSELVQRSQFHQARLTEHIVPSSPFYQGTVHKLSELLTTQGTSVADAQQQAVGVIGRMLDQQATLLAYIDVFRDYAIFAAIMIAIAFVLRRVNLTQTVSAH
jgi:DHA2 family multidrug resistance protein